MTKEGPIHKLPTNQFMNPTQAPNLLWIWQIHHRGWEFMNWSADEM